MTDRIRLTITVTQEVHDAFSRMAEVGGVSLGRAMGDWLESTLDGAQFVTREVTNAKELPKLMQRELLTRLGVNLNTAVASEQRRSYQEAWDATTGAAGARSARAKPGVASSAPSSNTGLNLRKPNPAAKA
jgi:hypothetical protein